ncbi:hypothetical protein PENTCL1PPCAC_28498 [Pristionchus entomophagus]|uniref:Uncharacterized protein n=1 Tax=Pristionchus entomophagus TaxID=358040 RepID=A0AAV5UK67_9BILA|nr:hypothetical protein PENTCL1PPCAC_28498 [Pristionchus entomophagus]
MRLGFLFLFLPVFCGTRMTKNGDEFLAVIAKNNQWEQPKEVVQPIPPLARVGSYKTRFFNWTTNITLLREWNDARIEVPMNGFDLAIACKFDKMDVVVRLVPAEHADECAFEAGVVAHCPDLNRIPVIYADVHGPGDFVLTTFSDGTPEGKHSTSGGFCSGGLKFPITIVNNTRNEKVSPTFSHHRAKNRKMSLSSNAASFPLAILIFLILQ